MKAIESQELTIKLNSPIVMMVLGAALSIGASMVVSKPGPREAEASPQSMATTLNTGHGPAISNYGPGISHMEYCEQVALSSLISSYHSIDDDAVIFERNPSLPGSAIQQFASVFGSAIANRSAPDLISGSRNESYHRMQPWPDQPVTMLPKTGTRLPQIENGG